MAQVRIKCEDIHEGMCYTAPVFFDDGKNMFLAEGKPVRAYHIRALERWSIPYLLTYGKLVDGEDAPKPKPISLNLIMQNDEEVEELEDLELLEEVKDLESFD